MSGQPRGLGLGLDDLDAIDSLRPEDWPPYRHTFERYRATPGCETWGFEDQGGLVAMGSLLSFGSSAWLAQVITAPRSRGRGWGTQVVDFLVDRAHRQGVVTVSLVATDLGFPLYTRAGFRVEGEYAFWTRTEPAPAEPEASRGLRPWSPDDSRSILDLDQAISGESRGSYLARDLGAAWVVSGGFYLPTAGEGLVVAPTEVAGVPVLHRRIDGATRVVIPTENRWAPGVLTSRGFGEAKRVRRMVLGPALERRPGACWSRIGGNLG